MNERPGRDGAIDVRHEPEARNVTDDHRPLTGLFRREASRDLDRVTNITAPITGGLANIRQQRGETLVHARTLKRRAR